MLNPTRGTRGMAVAPHALASQSALAVLREGGNAVEAMIAAAAAIAVVYPHMNSIGGDSFWLVHVPGQAPVGIDACGAAARAASIAWYAERGVAGSIPFRGGIAANTVAGTISGWGLAYEMSRELGGKLPLARLLADAIHYGKTGIPVTRSQHVNTATKRKELEPQPGFADAFLPAGNVPAIGARFFQPKLAATLEQLARAGLDDFYRGELARSIAADLAAAGSPGDAGGPRGARRTAPHAARAGALARARLQHAAADAGRDLARDPRSARPARDRGTRPGRRGLRASRRRGDQARLPRDPRPAHHRSRVHEGRRAVAPRAGEARRARRRDRTRSRRAVGPGQAALRHDLDGRDRRRRARGQLHPERLSRVRRRDRAERERHLLAEPRLLVQPGARVRSTRSSRAASRSTR